MSVDALAHPQIEAMRMQYLLGQIVDNAPIALIMTARDGRITLVNEEAENLFGYPRSELLGQHIEMLVPMELRSNHEFHRDSFFAQPAARAMGSGRELHARRKDGTEIPVEVALKPLTTDTGTFVLGVVVDITERKRLEATIRQASEQLEHRVEERTAELANASRDKEILLADLQAQRSALERLSREDPLTRLANRRDFDERLDNEIRRAERFGTPLAMAMLDLDYFKRVNDSFGHALGDAVLREAADLMRNECRAIDIVARYGGDEFALALPGTDLRAGITLGERIRFAFEHFNWSRLAPGLAVTISAGVSVWSTGLRAPELLATADAKLYKAKRRGRNCVLPREVDGQPPPATSTQST
jgi:diguanylate cyclase (GGDEF)-like protein/PAS domain S-box-containing protein